MRKKIILLAGIMTALSSCVPLATAVGIPLAIGAGAVYDIGNALEKNKGPKPGPEGTLGNLVEVGNYEYSQPVIEKKDGNTIVSGTFKIKVSNGDRKAVSQTLRDVAMFVPCYDKDGNRIGDAEDVIKVLRKNETLKYSAVLKSQEAASCNPAGTNFSIGGTEIEF
jgi:lipoprotein